MTKFAGKYAFHLRVRVHPFHILRIIKWKLNFVEYLLYVIGLNILIKWKTLLFSVALNVCTQRSWKRPYGVDLLVGGLDESGAFAIGARSQSAKTYLEREFESFAISTHDDLIKDALFAIKETLQGEKLTSSICIVVVVGLEEDFHILDQKAIQEFIELLEIREEAPVQEESGQDGGASMQEDRSPEVPPPAPMDIGDL
ncbi:hypothetical protein MKX03_020977 [Papaver bracteatum]|nr:hypothetical protein MKX03_020977 [Papaver bracteatum]